MILISQINKFTQLFLEKKSSNNMNNSYPKLIKKMNKNDFEVIYYEIINSFKGKHFEEIIKNKENLYESQIRNIKEYTAFFKINIHNYLKIILTKKEIFNFLELSCYDFNEKEIINKIHESLLLTFYDSIIDFNIKLNFINNGSVFNEKFSAFEEKNDYAYFLSEEILKSIKISFIHSHSIRFKYDNYDNLLINYYDELILDLRNNVENFNHNKKDIANEINRIKILHKKYEKFEFLKKYIKELNDAYEDLSKITNNKQKKTSNNQTDILPKEIELNQIKNKFSDEQVREIYNFFVDNNFLSEKIYFDEFNTNFLNRPISLSMDIPSLREFYNYLKLCEEIEIKKINDFLYMFINSNTKEFYNYKQFTKESEPSSKYTEQISELFQNI